MMIIAWFLSDIDSKKLDIDSKKLSIFVERF